MSPVTSRWEVPAQSSAPSVRPAVVEPDPPGVLALLAPGSPTGAGHGWRWPGRPRSRSPATHTTRSGPPTGRPPTRRRPSTGGGWPGRSCGPSTAPPPAPRPRPRSGGAGAEVQGVGQQLQPGQGGHPERGGERFGRERRHQRRPLPTQRLVLGHRPGRPVSDQVTNPDSAVAGCSTHHCAATRSLARPAWRSRTSASAARSSSHSASRSETSTGLPFNIVSNMSQSKQHGTDTPAPESGLKRGVVEKYFRGVPSTPLGFRLLFTMQGVVEVGSLPS